MNRRKTNNRNSVVKRRLEKYKILSIAHNIKSNLQNYNNSYIQILTDSISLLAMRFLNGHLTYYLF